MILRMEIVFLVFAVVLSSRTIAQLTEDEIVQQRRTHKALDLDDAQITQLTSQVDPTTFKYYLNEIMIPRVPGSEGHRKVKNFIVDEMQKLGWTVTLDNFKARVPKPFGTLPFENIIATPKPNAERFLIYSAHYDSKWFADNPDFVAATDSAVSCAMLLEIARTLGTKVQHLSNDLSIMFVFFDGEEAIQQWTASDSIYGARHLAKKWQQDNFLPRIDMLVLMDLIGAADPKFYSYFAPTQKWFERFINVEQKLGEGRHLSQLWQKPNTYFQTFSLNSFIEDDHVPFLRRGVPILHSIVYPFPEVWHKPTDNANAIDYNSVYDLTKIFTIFAAEYLQLQGNSGITFN